MKRILGFFAAAVLGLATTVAAHADSLNITLNNGSQYGHSGDYTFNATITAPTSNGGDVALMSDNYTVTLPATLDDSGFFNTPLIMSAGDSWNGDLFTVNIPTGTPWGYYFGTFSILDGDGNTLGSANYGVNVTPEPSSFLLLGTGLSGAVAAFRRRRSVV